MSDRTAHGITYPGSRVECKYSCRARVQSPVQAAGRIIQRTWARRNGNIRLQYLRIFSLVPGCLVANISSQWRFFMDLFYCLDLRLLPHTYVIFSHLYQFSLFVDLPHFAIFYHFLTMGLASKQKHPWATLHWMLNGGVVIKIYQQPSEATGWGKYL